MQCTAKSKQSGKRCGRHATPGLDKCASHAGVSKQERERATFAARALGAGEPVRDFAADPLWAAGSDGGE